MKPIASALLLVLAACAAPAPAPPPPPSMVDPSTWLQQVLGEWTAVCEANMGPDGTMRFEGTEKVRAIGGIWVLGEGSTTMMGQPQTSLMTLGYDPAMNAFVGTWVDSMQTHLWKYKGALDATGKTLTLDTEGPSFADPAKMARYRDAITIKDKNHKLLTSTMQNEDGTWTTILEAEYTRKK